ARNPLLTHRSFRSPFNSGGFRYLVKPVPPDELVASVRAATSLFRFGQLKQQALALLRRHRQGLSDRAGLELHFMNALDRLWVAFQPIIDCRSRSLVGYEALVRTSSPSLPNPAVLLDAAERLECVHVLGRQIRRLVSTRMPEAPPGLLFFVNVHPLDLNDEDLFLPSAPLSEVANRVVLEVTERDNLDAVSNLTGKLDSLRKLGFRIAVDDLGAGYAGLSSFTQLKPEVVKLDMSLIRCIEHSDQQQSIVRSMITVCRQELNVQVVCEGVETAAERETLERLGATLLQGYLIGHPSRNFETPNLEAMYRMVAQSA
ncbi:MAG TPA: EAL domain-containing protein, partial [Polyangiaceae bacterium]